MLEEVLNSKQLAINISTFTQYKWIYSNPCPPHEVTRETWTVNYKRHPICFWR